MEILRTPEDAFEDLIGYPYAPRYVNVGDDEELRMHYVDTGPRDAKPILMLHGEPSWSYLYRHMIPIFADAKQRAIAPDLIGFGKSDKPAARADYTYERHIEWVERLLLTLNLRDITLVCQDWGGLIGLRLVAEHPDRFARVVAANTFLPTGDPPLPDMFFMWRNLTQTAPELDVGRVLQGATTTKLSDQVVDAYNAPFPDESYKAGAREFPMLVPAEPGAPGAAENREAWAKLGAFTKPFLTAFSDGDPITAGADVILRERIPGARDFDPVVIKGAGHFLQEDRGPELAFATLDFMQATLS